MNKVYINIYSLYFTMSLIKVIVRLSNKVILWKKTTISKIKLNRIHVYSESNETIENIYNDNIDDKTSSNDGDRIYDEEHMEGVIIMNNNNRILLTTYPIFFETNYEYKNGSYIKDDWDQETVLDY